MNFSYNIDFEIAAIVFLAMLLLYLFTHIKAFSRRNQIFRELTFFMLATAVLDTAMGIMDAFPIIPDLVNVLCASLYLAALGITAYEYVRYMFMFIHEKKGVVKATIAFTFVLGIYLANIVVNIFTGHIFDHVNGEYVWGVASAVSYVFPLFLVLVGSSICIIYWNEFSRKERLAVLLFTALVVCGAFLQTTLLKKTLLSIFTSALGLMALMFFLEAPDILLLKETIDELNRKNADLENEKEALINESKAKSAYLANIAHELRNPLSIMIGYGDLVKKESLSKKVSGYGRGVSVEGKKLLSVVNNILDYSNMENGRFKLDDEPYSVGLLMQDVISYASYSADNKGLELTYTVDENIPSKLMGDSVHIMQIINNLVSNAVHFTEEGFINIYVKWKEENENSGIMTVYVRDTGNGITKEECDKIKNAINNLENVDDLEESSIGFGLYTVGEFLKLMDSELVIDSHYGSGSVFSFSLEQDIYDKTPARQEMDLTNLDTFKKQDEAGRDTTQISTILIIDDNEADIKIAENLLMPYHKVDVVNSGEAALKYLSEHMDSLPDALLVDFNMSDIDGYGIADKIKENENMKFIPIIFLMQDAGRDAEIKSYEYGATDYITKPYVGEIVKKRVENAIELYRLKRKLNK